jgi:transcription termination factor Rho
LRQDPERRPRADDVYVADVYVAPAQIRRYALRTGDAIVGEMRPPIGKEKFPLLVRITSVNGEAPAAVGQQR